MLKGVLVFLVLVFVVAAFGFFYSTPVQAFQETNNLLGYSTSAGNIASSDINYAGMTAAQRAYFTPVYSSGTPFPIRFTEQQFNYFGQTPYFLLDGRLYPKEAFNGFNDNDKARVTAFYPVRR